MFQKEFHTGNVLCLLLRFIDLVSWEMVCKKGWHPVELKKGSF